MGARSKSMPSRRPKYRGFGPCSICEFPITRSMCGPPGGLKPYCDLCHERLMASHGMLRQPEFPVI